QLGLAGPVTVALRSAQGEPYASAVFAEVADELSYHTARLSPAADDEHAVFSVSFTGPGTVWLDQASLMPTTAVHGFRADVVAAIRALRPSVIRFPGGNFAQCYHWTDGIGPRDARPTAINHAWGNAVEGNEMGTDEFIALCREVGAEPMMCVNIGDTGSARTVANNSTERAFRDALAWLEYCNGDASTEWGSRRAANGHAKPYDVRYWEIGNELWGDWEIGYVDAWMYARRFAEFAKALRAADPRIAIFACGHDMEWNRTLFEVAPEEIDWLVLHHYFRSGSFADCVAEPGNRARFIDETRDMAEQMRPGKPLRISFNEWNTSFGPEMNHSLMAAMWGASFLNEMIRRGDTVQMLNVSDLVNGWNGGIIQAHSAGLFVTPLYEIIRMHAHNMGSSLVKTSVACPPFDSPAQGRGHDVLDVVATRSEAGDRLYLSVVNKSLDPVEAEVMLDGCNVTGGGEAWTLTAPDVAVYNTADEPHDIRARSASFAVGSARFSYTFPGPSLTILAIPVSACGEAARCEIRGDTSVFNALVWAEDGSERVDGTADASGEYTLNVGPGLWRVSATARGLGIATSAPVEVPREHPGRADLELPFPFAACEAVGTNFDGADLADVLTPTYLAGDRGGTYALQDGTVMLKGGRDTRFGLLSAPIPWSTERATAVEAKIESYVATNALMTLYGGSGAGDFSHFCEVGIERGRAQAWAIGSSATGDNIKPPAVVRMVAGPPRGDGCRWVDFYVNDVLIHHIPAYPHLGEGSLRVFIYGWSESETVWDWVRAWSEEPTGIQGTVRSAAGERLPGVLVNALGAASANTDADGAYRLDAMPLGQRRVAAGGGGFGIVEREVTLAPGRPITLDFEVSPRPTEGALFDEFIELDGARWTVRRFGHSRAEARADDGGLLLESERGSAVVVESGPIVGTASGEVVIRARVAHFAGEATTLHVRSSSGGGGVDWSLRDGSLQARDGERVWWPAEARIAVPCDLTVVISAPGADGRRSARFHYNGGVRHTFEAIESLPPGEELCVMLGGGNCTARWDWVAVAVRDVK
ncbi:MAG: carboxypeptidase regulatory-like domain-containing protein, partial [Armatimonadota bacterium]